MRFYVSSWRDWSGPSVVLALSVATAACGGSDSSDTTPPTPTAGHSSGGSAGAAGKGTGGATAAGHAGASGGAGATGAGAGGAKGGAAGASGGSAGAAGAKGGAAGAAGGSGGASGGATGGSAGSGGAAPECVVDVDCHGGGDAVCGGDVCNAGKCDAAGGLPEGTEGSCTADADCKCLSLTATCSATHQCTFTTLAEAPPIPAPIVGPSRGSAVAVSYDDKIVAVANRDVGTVTIFSVAYAAAAPPVLTLIKEVPVGSGVQSEPWQVVIGGDNDTAYVALRGDGAVQQIRHIGTAPIAGTSTPVGSEATSVAITPSGKTVFASSWVDGTVTSFDAVTMAATGTIDLNTPLAASGLLGGVTARAALAHPRSIAISNDGVAGTDDSSETLLVTEYYAQRIEPESAKGANADTAKAGIVYSIPLGTKQPAIIKLPALADMGFQDQNGGTAGCYPNQLQSITIEGTHAHVLSVCASPKGPIGTFTGAPVTCHDDVDCVTGIGAGTCTGKNVTSGIGHCTANCGADSDCGSNGGKCDTTAHTCGANVASVKTITAPVVHTIDLTTGTSDAGTSLNAKWVGLYGATGLSAGFVGVKKLPLFANDFAFVPGTTIGYASANGADAAFRVRFDATGVIAGVGDEKGGAQPFLDLNPPMLNPPTAAGQNPNGIAITYTSPNGKPWAFVANDITRNVSVIDFVAQGLTTDGTGAAVAATSTNAPADDASKSVLRGKRFFNTGLGPWSLNGTAWGACQSCHGDGLSDNVTWYFARGPRQSTSLDGTFNKHDPTDQRILNWTAINDEIADFEANTRGIHGGVGAIVFQSSSPPAAADRIDFQGDGNAALNGSAALVADPNGGIVTPACTNDDWADIKAYVASIRSPNAPTNLVAIDVNAGADLFAANNCQGCHGGAKWTISHRFYDPSGQTGSVPTKTSVLFTTPWTPPIGFPAQLLPATTQANQVMRFTGTAAELTDPNQVGNFDQIECILRAVGTFGNADATTAVNGTFEVRANMTTPAQGNEPDGKGYNPPSLLGLGVGAPYFHAGNALTLESALADNFAAHHQALTTSNFLSASDTNADKERAQLVAYMLSIDESTTPVTAPAHAGQTGGDFCAAAP